ncbi:coiled-coil domain-containing protein mad1 [Teratosphaeriaceae sp. CCFEE 6253]|nr:coiled-coil domain-containing protein mad1 [Teratosphaeriaceae sp. CCFEE 6253]
MTARNQPTYDFLTAADASPPHHPSRETFRETLKQSTVSRADLNNENLRAQLNTLQYELDSLKQDRELTVIQHQRELREAQSRAEADYKRCQTAESAGNAAKLKADALARDFQDVQDRATNERIQLEKRIRGLQDDNRALREEVEEVHAEVLGQERRSTHAFGELEQKYVALQGSVEGVQQDLVGKVAALQGTQQRLAAKETRVGELEDDVLRLKSQVGDAETLGLIKKELSEQVAYVKKLEMSGRQQASELRQYQAKQKALEVVEEEKRALEARVRMMEDLRRELAEVQLQRRILEDEKRGWTSYLETEAGGEGDMRYESPEQMARAFLQERLDRLGLLERLGAVQPELTVREENIRSLEDDKAALQAELEKLRAAGGAQAGSAEPSKVRLRLERQKNLLAKEVEYLRAQVKMKEDETTEFGLEQPDAEHLQRIHDLEDLVAQLRSEMQDLHAELSKAEVQAQGPAAQSPQKRPREEDAAAESERLNDLRRRAQTLQHDLETLRHRNQSLEAELQASTSQLKSLKETSRTRVLELRDNPTAAAEAIKLSTLRTLRDENAALLNQLEGKPHGTKVVPISTLDNIRLQLADSQAQIAAQEKKTARLKQIYSAKALEFREAVCSILGWKLDFMPNGRVKATSILYPGTVNGEGEEEENSIVFDGENGTMKVSGGPQSAFAGEIRGLIEFWVEGRKEIPGFLAACTLEFWEKSTRAAAT